MTACTCHIHVSGNTKNGRTGPYCGLLRHTHRHTHTVCISRPFLGVCRCGECLTFLIGVNEVVLYGCGTWSLTLREERRLRVFDNKVLKEIFGHKGDEVTGYWRKLHNEELNDPYTSPNIVWVITSRKNEMGGACSAYGREERRTQGFSGGNLRERDHLGDPGVDGRIILRWIFKNERGRHELDFVWLEIGTGGGHL